MENLYEYKQEKNSKLNTTCYCKLVLTKHADTLTYTTSHVFNYRFNYSTRTRTFNLDYNKKSQVIFENKFLLNLKNGDVETEYNIITNTQSNTKTKISNSSNDFNCIFKFMENAHIKGERNRNFWGAKYNRATQHINKIFYDILKDDITNDYFFKKLNLDNRHVNFLYQLVVLYHLEKKNIKPHNNIFFHIQHVYPKKKWLDKNENKFLPAVLDSMGIKSKYLIKELSNNTLPINILSVNFLCKMFGENHLSYLSQFNWKEHSIQSTIKYKKTHTLEHEFEKKSILKVLKKWDYTIDDDAINILQNILRLRDNLIKNGIKDLKFKPKNYQDLDIIQVQWEFLKQYFSKKYKLKYNINPLVVEDIEKPIITEDKTFNISLLLSEEQFKLEGVYMKNCMGNQFPMGILNLFVSMNCGKKRINLQYYKGKLKQSYGKANSETPKDFKEAIGILSDRILKYKNLKWEKEKYEIIN